MSNKLFDGKSWYGYSIWNVINRIVVATQFDSIEITGLENLPENDPFILVANHSSRWDGLVVQYLLNRKANYMVSPNEIKGMQKPAVLSVGAFPANPRLDLVGYATRQLRRGEPVVVFPEGNVFYDGNLRRFKTGTAKIALNAIKNGLDVNVVPLAIKYCFGPCNRLEMQVGEAVNCSQVSYKQSDYREKIKELTAIFRQRVDSMLVPKSPVYLLDKKLVSQKA